MVGGAPAECRGDRSAQHNAAVEVGQLEEWTRPERGQGLRPPREGRAVLIFAGITASALVSFHGGITGGAHVCASIN
jgi:hypothetical protein